MPDPPPPPPQEPPPSTGWSAGHRAGNPRLLPSRREEVAAAEVQRAEAQRAELEAEMARTGQTDAITVAAVVLEPASRLGHAFSASTWIEGRTTVLTPVDVIRLFELPTEIDGPPTITAIRWDVVARVCAARCWQRVPGLDPTRWITRRWPSTAELDVLRGLAIAD